MADPFNRDRFAAAVRRKLEGVSLRQACAAFPHLNIAMLSRAAKAENLSIGSFLTICRALRLRPLSFLDGVKRARPTPQKTTLKQTVTAFVKRETERLSL